MAKEWSGIGRPPMDPELKKIQVSYKLPKWLVDFIKSKDQPASHTIEEALIEYYGLKQP